MGTLIYLLSGRWSGLKCAAREKLKYPFCCLLQRRNVFQMCLYVGNFFYAHSFVVWFSYCCFWLFSWNSSWAFLVLGRSLLARKKSVLTSVHDLFSNLNYFVWVLDSEQYKKLFVALNFMILVTPSNLAKFVHFFSTCLKFIFQFKVFLLSR